jgi:serine/threonine protein kinase/tetratricopeptide (TPR) repeat protein
VTSSSELLQLAGRLARIGQVDRAQQAYRRVLREAQGDERGLALIGMAGIQSDLGDVDGALRGYRAATVFPGLEANALTGVALVLHKAGDLEGALAHYAQAEAAAEREDDLLELCRSVGGQAELMVQLGRAEDAERKLRVTLALGPSLPQQGRYWLNAALGEVLRQRGRPLEARSAYLKAASLAEHDAIFQLVNKANLGLTELLLGDGPAARAYLEPVRRGMAGGGTLFEATMEAIWLAVLAHTGAFTELAERLDPTLAMVEQRGVTERDVAWALGYAGDEAARAGEQASAVRCLAAALRVWDLLGMDAEGRDCERRLQELHRQGAPVPVGPWLLESLLGEGGMGQVWLAQDRSGPLAVKLLHREASLKLEEEVRAAAGLDHPFVTEPLELIEAGPAAACMLGIPASAPVLAMELATGGSLRERAGRMHWDSLRRALGELLQALAHAHARGIVHLDIKPENVLVHEGRVRLADFGLARAFGGAGDRVCGTPAFMAPEAIRGQQVGPATDLYMVGCLAWAMAASRLPFEGTPVEILRRQLADPLPPLESVVEVPRRFEAWIRRMTCKRDEERFSSAAAARAALMALKGPSAEVSAPRPRGIESELTWFFDLALPELPPEPSPAPVEADPPRRLPPDWRLPRRGRSWSGPSLFRWRRWPLVGRERELDALWAEALRCQDGETRIVSIVGPPGSGRSHLLRELGERLRELDGPPCTLLDGEPLPQAPSGLVVHVGELPHADRYLVLKPVGAAAEQLIDRLVPLAPVLRRTVLELTDADPAFIVELLAHWVEQGWLGPSSEGLVLRPGHRPEQLPASLREQALSRVDPEDGDIAELLATLGSCTARELGRACRLADLDPPRPALRRLQGAGLLRQDGGLLRLSPVLHRSLEQRADELDRAVRWHVAAAEVVSDPARRAHHLLEAGAIAEAAPLLLELAIEAPLEAREALAVDGLRALDLLLISERDPRRIALHQAALEGATARGDAGAMREHRTALGRLRQA